MKSLHHHHHCIYPVQGCYLQGSQGPIRVQSAVEGGLFCDPLDLGDFHNYCPFSNIPFKVIKDSWMKYIVWILSNVVSVPYGYGTEAAFVPALVDDLYQKMERGSVTQWMLLDFSVYLYTIDHSILMDHLLGKERFHWDLEELFCGGFTPTWKVGFRRCY